MFNRLLPLSRIVQRNAMPMAIQARTIMKSTNTKIGHRRETDQEFRERFISAFSDPNIDNWWMRKHLTDLGLEDAVPEPDICIAVFKACRRLNDLGLAIRFLEQVRYKCQATDGVYEWLMPQIKPTMEEMGIPSLEEIGYNKPELSLTYEI